MLRGVAGKGRIAAPGTDRDHLLKTAHSLAGAGGTFGFPVLSERASRLETQLISDADTSAICAAFEALVDELERMAAD